MVEVGLDGMRTDETYVLLEDVAVTLSMEVKLRDRKTAHLSGPNWFVGDDDS